MEINVEKFTSLMTSSEVVYLFIHDFPDPDSLGAALGLKKLIHETFKKPSLIFGSGVSHPQNRTMLSILNIDLENPYEFDFDAYPTATYIFIDFNPYSNNFEYGKRLRHKPDWVIDHHILSHPAPLAEGETPWHIETYGACCTIVKEYFDYFDVKFNPENPEDAEIATAMILGIKTDTKDLLGEDTTPADRQAFEDLSLYYDPEKYNQIINFEFPSYFFELLAHAYTNGVVEGSLVILNLGYISSAKRDAIPYIADLWQRGKDINSVVAYAIIDKSIHASARVKVNAHMKATDLLKALFLYNNGEGGGHPHMAGARIPLAPFWDPDILDPERKQGLLDIIMQMIANRAKKLVKDE